MLGKRIINTGTVACTTDTNQILDPGTTDSFALYRFEDNADDTSNSTGKFGKGAGLDGTTSIELPGQILGDLHNANTHSISVSTWIYWQGQTSESYAHLISAGYNQSGKSFWVGLGYSGTTSGVINELYVSGSGVSGGANWSGVSMPINEWSHVVFTWTGTSAKLYLNGNLIATATMPTLDWRSSGNGFRLGRYYYNSNYYVKGFYDQTRIFNKAITQTEVNTLYAETTSTVDTVQILGDTSLKALYKFDGNLNDSSGNNYAPTANSSIYYNYNGTASGVTYVTGKFGKAASFDGSNDYIDLPLTSIFGGKNTLSVSFWFKTTTTGRERMFTDYAQTSRNCDIIIDSGNIQVETDYNQNTNLLYTSTATYNDGNWHHLVVALNQSSSQRTIYVDGSLVDTGTLSSNSWSGYGQKVTVGGFYSSSGGYTSSLFFDGQIDQLRIFEKSLSPGEVNSLYNETATSAALSTIDNPSTVAYYKMADATDETGSHNLTASNVDFNVEGKYGFAGKFNGTNSYLYAANSVQQPTKNFSVSCWVNFDTIKAASVGVIGNFKTGGTPQIGWAIAHQSGTPFQFWADGTASSNGAKAQGTTNPVVGTWYNIVGTYDGANIKIYVNGSLEGTTAYSATPAQTDQPLVIGRWYGNYNDYYTDGKIDQVRIFNKAISATEVETLYNEIQCANTITAPESYFNTKLWTGDGNARSITGIGFDPDFVWIKKRANDTKDHRLFDTVRGANKVIYSSRNLIEATPTQELTAFVSGGFSLGNHTSVNDAASDTYVSWNWKAASSNTTNNDGTIASTVRASQESGFSIVKYTGNGTAGATVGHGLSVKPQFILIKNLDTTVSWIAYDTVNNVIGYLDLTDSLTDGRRAWAVNNTDPTSTLVTLGNNQATNAASDFIMYCFANVDGHQRIGSYFGNGSANGPFVFTGFEPAWLMIKRIDAAGEWNIFDNKRDTENPRDITLWAQDNSTESTASQSGVYDVDFFTNGFQIKNSYNPFNNSSGTYLFMAIAANPDTTAPTKANSFKTVLYTGNGDTTNDTLISGVGFKPDLVWIKARTTYNHLWMDSVRGTGSITSNDQTTERTNYGRFVSYEDDGFKIRANNAADLYKINRVSNNFVSWNWKALDHDRNLHAINTDGSITTQVSANPAAGFSIASYRGVGYPNATTATVGHGLSQAPDLVIIKGTGGTGQSSGAGGWAVGTGVLASDNWLGSLYLHSDAVYHTAINYFWNGSPTSSVVKLKNDWFVNGANNTYIMYSWHTVAGYSKVGVYSGTGISGKEVTLDFSPSFVLIKRTNATAGWIIVDDQRSTYELYPHLGNQEDTTTTSIVLGTNKFTINSTGTWYNASGGTYLYMAFS